MNSTFSNPWRARNKKAVVTIVKARSPTPDDNVSPLGSRNGSSTKWRKRQEELAARIAADAAGSHNAFPRGLHHTVAEKLPETVHELAQRYLAAPTTKKWRLSPLRQFCKWLGSVRLEVITSEHLMQLQAKLGATNEPDYVNRVMSCAKDMFNYACTREWIDDDHNPINGVAAPSRTESNEIRKRREEQEQFSLLSMHDIALLVAHAEGWVLTVVLLGLFAGLRGQESRALQRRHTEILAGEVRCHIMQAIKTVEADGREIEVIGKTKSKAGRRIFDVEGVLYDHMLTIVAMLKNPDDFILPPQPGEEFMSYRTLWQGLHDLQVSLGIGRRLPDGSYVGTYGAHALRHTCVALLIWNGKSEDEIGRMIGHRLDDVTLTLKGYGYLFDAQIENPDEWPIGPVPTSSNNLKSIKAEMEDE